MVWRADTAYLEGLAFFTAIVDGVSAGSWQRASPCAGWRAIDVLGHVGETTEYGIALLSGDPPARWQPASTPGDAVGPDPQAWWHALAERAAAVMADVDLDAVVTTPRGERPVGEGLAFPAVDLFLHGWDLARSTGGVCVLPEDAIAFTRAVLGDVPPEMLRSPRTFGPERAAGPGASAADALLAWSGRDPQWRPPAPV